MKTVKVVSRIEVDIDDVFEEADFKDIIKSFKEGNYNKDEITDALVELLQFDIIKTQKLKDFINKLKLE